MPALDILGFEIDDMPAIDILGLEIYHFLGFDILVHMPTFDIPADVLADFSILDMLALDNHVLEITQLSKKKYFSCQIFNIQF